MVRRALVGCVILLVLTILAMNPHPVSAYTITPNPPVAGQPFTITANFGSDTIFVYQGSGCPDGHFNVGVGMVTLTEPAGQYSFVIEHETVPNCVNFTVNSAPPIPEYPLGLPLLAILTVIGYGLVRRRTRNNPP